MRSSSLLLLLVACAESQPPEPPEPERVVRPASTTEVERSEYSFALPSDWVASTQIHVVDHPDFGTLVGGPSGLFRLQVDGLTSVHEGEQINEFDEGAVYDLIVDGAWVWVASEQGLSVYDGRLRASPVVEQIESGPVRSLARMGEDLLIATDSGVWSFDGSRLSRLLELPSVLSIIVGAQGAVASLRSANGQVMLLKRTESGLMQQDLGDQGHLRHVVPAANDRLFALEGGRLLVRESAPEGLVWHSVALGTDSAEPSAVRGWALNAGVAGQGVWMAVGDRLGFWHDDQLTVSALPAGLGVVTAIEVVAEERLWLIGRERMVRLGGDSLPVATFCADIEPYYQTHCAHCHNNTAQSQAVDLSTFDVWVERFESITSLVQAGAMPKDAAGRVDGAHLNLLQRWREGGMVECDTP